MLKAVYSAYYRKHVQLYVVTNNFCNCNCYYCFNEKCKVQSEIDFVALQKFIFGIYALKKMPIHVELIGGEPTLCSRLYDLVESTKAIDVKYHIYSNITACIQLYEKILSIGNSAFEFSWHSCNKDIFIDKLKQLLQFRNNIVVRVMAENRFFNESVFAYNQAKQLGFKCVFAPLDFNFSTMNIIYTDKKECYSKKQVDIIKKIDEEHHIYDYVYEYDDKIECVSITEVALNQKCNTFKNWICQAGDTYFAVNYDGNVYTCVNDIDYCKPLENIIHLDNALKVSQIVKRRTLCKYKTCDCMQNVEKTNIFRIV